MQLSHCVSVEASRRAIDCLSLQGMTIMSIEKDFVYTTPLSLEDAQLLKDILKLDGFTSARVSLKVGENIIRL